MHNYLTEFIGTFFLVLTIGLTALLGSPLAPIAIGSVLMVMVYIGGHISGAHYNPAVSLAVYLRGKLPAREIAPYMTAQILGAAVASLAVLAILGVTFAPAPNPNASLIGVVLAEVLFTFALGLAVLNTATVDDTAGNSYFGLAIGFTVMVGVFAVGPVSGGVFNPAVGIGTIIVNAVAGGGPLTNLVLYIVAPLAGGAGAAYTFRAQHPVPKQRMVAPEGVPSLERDM